MTGMAIFNSGMFLSLCIVMIGRSTASTVFAMIGDVRGDHLLCSFNLLSRNLAQSQHSSRNPRDNTEDSADTFHMGSAD